MSEIKITVQGRSAVGKTTVIEVIMHALRQQGLNKIEIHGVDESLVNDKVGVPDFERLKTLDDRVKAVAKKNPTISIDEHLTYKTLTFQ